MLVGQIACQSLSGWRESEFQVCAPPSGRSGTGIHSIREFGHSGLKGLGVSTFLGTVENSQLGDGCLASCWCERGTRPLSMWIGDEIDFKVIFGDQLPAYQ